MITPPSTGIPVVDAELRRRAPFANADEAEAAVAKLLMIWRVLRSSGPDDDDTDHDTDPSRQANRR
jgi:hypothetical protein